MGIKADLIAEAQRRGIRPSELARMAGVSRQAVYEFVDNMERGNTTLDKLADALEMKIQPKRATKKGAANEQ